MDTKLNFEQRNRADLILGRLSAGDDLEGFIFEFIATRDAYNKMRRLAQQLRHADNSQRYAMIPVMNGSEQVGTVGNILAEMFA